MRGVNITMKDKWCRPMNPLCGEGRFTLLLISLILLFLARPFLEDLVAISLLVDIFVTFVLFSSIYAIGDGKRVFITALILASPAIAGQWSHYFVERAAPEVVGKAFGIIFLSYTAVIILKHIFRERRVTPDLIIGAICVYFLIGHVWGVGFHLVEIYQPGSFSIEYRNFSEASVGFTYYSFITVTTLGYGDIAPLSNIARSLSLLEAVMGQMYLAVLVARLVGLQIAQSQSGHGDNR
jgi:hypothetical protein